MSQLFAVLLLLLVDYRASAFGLTTLSSSGGSGSSSSSSRRGLVRHSRSRHDALRMGYDTMVKVSSSFEAKCNTKSDTGVSLNNYMQLPVDQYVCIKMPLDATLERMDATFFNLTVPPVTFFNLQVSPMVLCKVSQSDDTVVIESNEVILRGSPYVEGLNGCFKINIKTAFNWIDSADAKSIFSSSKIDVAVDPPAPFKYFGKTILEKTGTLAMSIALRQIENAFVQSLARDYERWALDKEYRNKRARGQCETSEDGSRALPSDSRTDSSQNEAPAASTDVASTISGSPTAALLLEPVLTESQFAAEVADMEDADAPAVLTDDICLVPGEPVVRIEEAPANARRIFTGVDIAAKVEDVWGVLTNYEGLQDVIPSLVKNKVVYRTENGGARLSQVGGAKVLPGVTFTAKTVLDVCVYLEENPLPASMSADHLQNEASDKAVRAFDKTLPLTRNIFPRPYAITSLPHRDITMQNVLGEGDFEHYQGIWRMQALPNCAPDGTDACRLTYAVELRPKGFLPVKLIEGRIASDLRANLGAIREHVEKKAVRIKPMPSPPLAAVGSSEELGEFVDSQSGMASILATIKTHSSSEPQDVAASPIETMSSTTISSSSSSSNSVEVANEETQTQQQQQKRFSFRRLLGISKEEEGIKNLSAQEVKAALVATKQENTRLKEKMAKLEKEAESYRQTLGNISKALENTR